MSGIGVICFPMAAFLCVPVMSPREPEQPKPAQPEAFGLVAVHLKGSSGNSWANYWEHREMRIATRLEF